MRPTRSKTWFTRFAKWTAKAAGRPAAFTAAVAIIGLWALTGPLFGFSDTWQLIINTGTTIVTFLMVFLIQNTQNRDTQAIQLKLDELIRVTDRARNRLVNLEDLTEEELDRVKAQFAKLAKRAPPRAQRDIEEAQEDLEDAEEKLDEAKAHAAAGQRQETADGDKVRPLRPSRPR
jgi:low affinity Fe/Cu permease